MEPVRWQDDWPIIGEAANGATTGEPVLSDPIPGHPRTISQSQPQTSDEFNSEELSPQWEWNHNPDDAHWSLTARYGYLRLIPMPAEGLLDARNTLTQSMQSNSFEFTVRMDLTGMKTGVCTGLAMFEKSASGLEITQSGSERRLSYFHLPNRTQGPSISQNILQLRVRVDGDGARYSYSLDDGRSFQPLGAATRDRPHLVEGSPASTVRVYDREHIVGVRRSRLGPQSTARQ